MADRACRDCGELISAFIDGIATREENERLRQHLASCAECRATLDSYRQIGGSIRALPAIHAPQHLTEAIFAQTIDAEPRRLFLITSRLGYSLAAVASVLLIFVVAAYLIIDGYQRGIDPVVDTSEPKTNDVWELQEPIEITFNKEMNRESVIAALGMQPSGEKDRLTLTWDDNTLIIGGNTTLKPGASYEIKISTDATDTYGNQLKEPFQLAFTTQETLATVQTPTPQPSPTATTEQANPTQIPQATPSTPAGTPDADNKTPVAPTATSGGNPSPGTGSGTQVVPGDPNPPSDPTATASAPTATPTPTEAPVEATGLIEPTATTTPTPPPTATMTPVPPTQTPTATPTATATAPVELTATATPNSIPVTGAIGDVYWSDQTVQDRLGDPTEPETGFVTLQLDFQRGVMLLDEYNEYIYVLKFGSGWDKLDVPAPDPEYPRAELIPDGDIYVPGGAFGALWEDDQSVRDAVGYALKEFAISDPASVQHFIGGLMLTTPSTVYIIYGDSTWDWFIHSSGS